MHHYEIRKIGVNKGARRVWIQGQRPARGGFLPGCKYNARVDEAKKTIVLEVQEDGLRVVSSKVKDNKVVPVIDLNSETLLSVFEGIDTVRVVVAEGRIFILPVASELRAKERLDTITSKMNEDQPVSVGAFASGIGILDMAAHEGLEKAGVESKLAFANEIRDDCVEHAMAKNPTYTNDTVTLTAPLQELVFDPWAMSQLPRADLLIAGTFSYSATLSSLAKLDLA